MRNGIQPVTDALVSQNIPNIATNTGWDQNFYDSVRYKMTSK